MQPNIHNPMASMNIFLKIDRFLRVIINKTALIPKKSTGDLGVKIARDGLLVQVFDAEKTHYFFFVPTFSIAFFT